MLRQHFAAILIGCCTAVSASAQSSALAQPYPQAQTPVVAPYAWGFGHASTAAEGYLRGSADLARGLGEAARSQAEAEIFAAEAQAKSIENRKYRIEQYYALQALNREHRKSRRSGPKNTGGVTMPTVKAAADRRGLEHFSPSGSIEWPLALQGEPCARERQAIEAVMVRRAAGVDTRIGTSEYRQARAAIESLLANLKSQVSEVPQMEYMAAKRQLTDLKLEIARAARPLQYTKN